MSDRLHIQAVSVLEMDAVEWPVFDIAASAIDYPFRYSDADWADLGALSVLQHPDPSGRLHRWARSFVLGDRTDTLALLKDVSAGVSAAAAYEIREDEGTQSPAHTLDRACGSCRDFAVLFAEAVRALGFGARVVSGYLHDPTQGLLGSSGPGSTHAWAEAHFDNIGWIGFDVSNGHSPDQRYIRVATGLDYRDAAPVRGMRYGAAQENLVVQLQVQQ